MNRKIILIQIIMMCLLFSAILMSCGKKETPQIDVSQYINVEFNGVNGSGHAIVTLDEAINDEIMSVMPDDNEVSASGLLYSILVLTHNVEFDGKHETLSNGEEVTYNVDYDIAYAEKLGIELINTSKTFTVEGLSETLGNSLGIDNKSGAGKINKDDYEKFVALGIESIQSFIDKQRASGNASFKDDLQYIGSYVKISDSYGEYTPMYISGIYSVTLERGFYQDSPVTSYAILTKSINQGAYIDTFSANSGYTLQFSLEDMFNTVFPGSGEYKYEIIGDLPDFGGICISHVDESRKQSSDDQTEKIITGADNQNMLLDAAEWAEAYRSFLSDSKNYNSLLEESWSGVYEMVPDTNNKLFGFTLFDIDNDEIPELLLEKVIKNSTDSCEGYNAVIGVFKYDNRSVIQLDNLIYSNDYNPSILDNSILDAYKTNHGNGLLSADYLTLPGFFKDKKCIITTWDGGGDVGAIIEYDSNLNSKEIYREEIITEYDNDTYTEKFIELKQDNGSIYNKYLSDFIPFNFIENNESNRNLITSQNYNSFNQLSKFDAINDFKDRIRDYPNLYE